MGDLDSLIDASHRQAEEAENTARHLEARICRIPGADRHLPRRGYGKPVDPQAIKQNLTLRSMIARHDPALASYLGIASGEHRRNEEEQAIREMQMQRMQMLTQQAREQNQQARNQRENAALNGFNLNTGRRYGT